jgi:hypothetical protein
MTRAQPKSAHPTHALLALVALACWAACALACRAAWSPDGTRILFPFHGPEGKGGGIALHDVRNRTTRCVFWASRKKGPILSTRWFSDGKRAVVLALETEGQDHLEALVLEVERGDVLKHYSLGEAAGLGAESLIHPPALLRDRYLFVVDKRGLARLDLETGEIKRRKVRGLREIALTAAGNTVRYAARNENAKVLEIGELDPETLEPKAAFTLEKGPQDGMVLGPGWDAGGLRALLSDLDGQFCITLYRGDKLERTMTVEPPDGRKKLEFGDTVWSQEGKALLAVYVVEDDGRELGVCEEPVEGGTPRFLRLFGGKSGDDSLLLLSLSPDGKTLAAQRILDGDKDDEKGAPAVDATAPVLFLIDLTSPERKVTKVAAPAALPASTPRKAKD